MNNIEILEEFIKNYKEIQEKYKDDEIQAEIERSCYFEEVPAEAIENLIKENKELKEHLQKYYNEELFTAKQLKKLEENQRKYFIHKSKIREIIREYSVPRGKNERFMPYEQLKLFLQELEKILKEGE